MNRFAEAELVRLINLLSETDPRTHEYHTLLQSIEALNSIGDTINGIAELPAIVKEDIIRLEKIVSGEIQVPSPAEQEAEASPEAEPEHPVETPWVEEAEAAETSAEIKYSPAEARAALAGAKKKGVDVTSIIKSFGVDNFSAIPDNRYPELMARVQEELGKV